MNRSNHSLEDILPLLSASVQKKVLKHQRNEDQWRVIFSDLFTRKILADELHVNKNSLRIETNAHGKPFLEGNTRYFNLSHAGKMIVLATDDHPLGIDVEYVQPLDDLENLISWFSDEEKKFFLSMSSEKRLECFYELWTLKESYLKALGKGLDCPLQSFSLKISKEKEVVLSKRDDSNIEWHFKQYIFQDHYKCAICAQHRHFPERAVEIFADDLL